MIGLVFESKKFANAGLPYRRTSNTGFSSHLGAKLRDWADRQAQAGCYSWAALSSNHSKTRYVLLL